MRRGRANTYMVLQKPVTPQEREAGGGEALAFEEARELWGSLEPEGGTESEQGGRVTGYTYHKATVDAKGEKPDQSWRIIAGNRILEVFLVEVGGWGRGMEYIIHLRERMPQAPLLSYGHSLIAYDNEGFLTWG